MTMQEANKAYTERNFQQAIKDYEALLHQGRSVALYYNLGNAYYRTDNITQAILNYERALRLSPGNSDIRFNLQLARSKTIDKYADGDVYIGNWADDIQNGRGIYKFQNGDVYEGEYVQGERTGQGIPTPLWLYRLA